METNKQTKIRVKPYALDKRKYINPVQKPLARTLFPNLTVHET